ncbi:MAG: 3-deoxy-manno-octulosonate cytidylyltransferase [Bacteroidota bacterium]
MKFIGIIPARYQSSRFPGKPLAMINGKTMIQRVYEQALSALDHVWVATDDHRIADTVTGFGGNPVLTSPDHKSGTDRCAEAADALAGKIDFDVVINIQGDEPFIRPAQIRKLMDCFTGNTEIATLVRKIQDVAELADANKPKVVLNNRMEALYFSRAAIPYVRGTDFTEWTALANFWAHIGIYAYRTDILRELTALQPGILENLESLEQLRWLENGYRIKAAETDYQSFGIDTPEDLERALKHFSD